MLSWQIRETESDVHKCYPSSPTNTARKRPVLIFNTDCNKTIVVSRRSSVTPLWPLGQWDRVRSDEHFFCSVFSHTSLANQFLGQALMITDYFLAKLNSVSMFHVINSNEIVINDFFFSKLIFLIFYFKQSNKSYLDTPPWEAIKRNPRNFSTTLSVVNAGGLLAIAELL